MLTVGFMGSSEVSLRALKILLNNPKLSLTSVWTNPPKPSGRKQTIRPTPVAQYIKTLPSPPTLIPIEKIGSIEISHLKDNSPDVIIVAAFGQILPSEWLTIPPLGCYNLHFSLLPQYRGASPIQSAILDNEAETGITIQKVVKKLDAGDVVLREKFSLLKKTSTPTNIPVALSAPEAFAKSIELSEKLFPKLIDILIAAKSTGQEVPGTSQDHILDVSGNTIMPSYCYKFTKEDGLLSGNLEDITKIYRRYLALDPWPGLYFMVEDTSYTVTGLSPVSLAEINSPSFEDALKPYVSWPTGVYLFSSIIDTTNPNLSDKSLGKKKIKRIFLWIKSASNQRNYNKEILEIIALKKAGKNSLSVKEFLNGCKWKFPLKLAN